MLFKNLEMKKMNISIKLFALAAAVILVISCTEDMETFPRTRLFKPVLADGTLETDLNTIIVNISPAKEVISYQIEVSRDTFKTIEYSLTIDTSYVVLNAQTVGEELFWNTIYQVRATAYADDTEYNSLVSDFGSIRTEKFPSNLIAPQANDMIDTKVKVEWQRIGLPVDEIRVFSPTDLRLSRPLSVLTVTTAEELAGEKIISKLAQNTAYQIAIYSGGELRGWENYKTVVSLVNYNGPNVTDLTQITDPTAAENAYMGATDGDTIVLKKGFKYLLPTTVLADKSITFVGALGFEDSLASLYTAGNWQIAEGAAIDHIRFTNLNLYGEDWTGDYVMNNDKSGSIGEIVFTDCNIHHFRGLLRIKDAAAVHINTFKIDNCIVNQIGNYGLLTVDNRTSSVDDIVVTNTTLVNIEIGISTYTNTNSVTFDGISANNFPRFARWIFRYREPGTDQSVNGISITNSIFGHAWTQGGEDFTFSVIQGLDATVFNIVNVYGTSGFVPNDGGGVAGMPSSTYAGTAEDLWVAPNPEDLEAFDLNFKDSGFNGRTDSGDTKWRTEF